MLASQLLFQILFLLKLQVMLMEWATSLPVLPVSTCATCVYLCYLCLSVLPMCVCATWVCLCRLCLSVLPMSVCATCVRASCANLMAGQASMKVLHKAH